MFCKPSIQVNKQQYIVIHLTRCAVVKPTMHSFKMTSQSWIICLLRDGGMHRWTHAHQLGHFGWIICCSALCPTRIRTLARHCCWFKPAITRKFWASRNYSCKGGRENSCFSSCCTTFLKKLWACSTGLKKELYGTRKHPSNPSGTTMLRWDHTPS